MTRPTPSQTIGPFFRLGLAWMGDPEAAAGGGAGAITLHGTVRDGAGDPVADAMIEIWQATADEVRPERRGWTGFGRSLTDERGRYRFPAVRQARAGDGHAPHVEVSVFARGLLQRLMTRVYFPDEEAANRTDPVLTSIDPARRPTLVAVADAEGLRFDICLQGRDETVFFAW